MPTKKGLLIAPEFPADSFWSFKYVMKYIGRKTAFPPLGLLTFAALMPQDEWSFELVDLNVRRPSPSTLRRKIQESDAVFASAMNVQRASLATLLDGPAKGTDTPWVLGGPLASTYRSAILQPKNNTDATLHRGLDYLVWGDAAPWIEALTQSLSQHRKHRTGDPQLLIAERVLEEPDASRKYLMDRTIFQPFDNLPVPRWDLIDIRHYRDLMLQTTAGCRFRCNFCDIIQFNGGFARAKGRTDVTRELQAIYDTGFRGAVFTVDDNFVSEPKAMEEILDSMIEFQRQHDYPFEFFTQASLDLGKDALAYLIPLMRQAAFTMVFLGIENPDPVALRHMNKIQNIKNAPKETIRRLQAQGIEVQAGFIYGSDTDTRQTANKIVDFAEQNGVFSAMTGTLTPLPHTPLYVELRKQGRLIEADLACNNVDAPVHYKPVMGLENMQGGFLHILESLFNYRAMYERAEKLLNRVDMHIFRNTHFEVYDFVAFVRSFVKQSLGGSRASDNKEYLKFLRKAFLLDKKLRGDILTEANNLGTYWKTLSVAAKGPVELDSASASRFTQMLPYAQDWLVRCRLDMSLSEIRDFLHGTQEAIIRGVVPRPAAQSLYEATMEYLDAKRKRFQFPGSHLIKAIELSIMGIHYQTVVTHVLSKLRQGDGLAISTEPMRQT